VPRDDKLAEGIAATVALAQPILRSGQHFGTDRGLGWLRQRECCRVLGRWRPGRQSTSSG
jgi:hypothetical protein